MGATAPHFARIRLRGGDRTGIEVDFGVMAGNVRHKKSGMGHRKEDGGAPRKAFGREYINCVKIFIKFYNSSGNSVGNVGIAGAVLGNPQIGAHAVWEVILGYEGARGG